MGYPVPVSLFRPGTRGEIRRSKSKGDQSPHVRQGQILEHIKHQLKLHQLSLDLTGHNVRELLFQLHAILQIPGELLICKEAKGSVNDL